MENVNIRGGGMAGNEVLYFEIWSTSYAKMHAIDNFPDDVIWRYWTTITLMHSQYPLYY